MTITINLRIFSLKKRCFKVVYDNYHQCSLSNQVKKIVFLESVTFQLHARMLSSEVAQSLKSHGHFSDLEVGIALRHRHVGFFG